MSVAVLVAGLLGLGAGSHSLAWAVEPQPGESAGGRPFAHPSAEAQPGNQAELLLRPVPGPIVEGFRAPEAPWGPGNRGVDLEAAAGEPVVAASGGRVAFAGVIGPGRHVSIVHADGRRSTYAFLAEVSVRRGQVVAAGETVGVAAGPVHFGVLAGQQYVDPEPLLAPPGQVPPGAVRLVPYDGLVPGSAVSERSAVSRLVSSARRSIADEARSAWSTARTRIDETVGELRGILHYGAEATLIPLVGRAVRQVRAYQASRDRCTPASVVPPPPASRRLVVLVAGLGSSSAEAAIDDVDTQALGYQGGDVYRYSYRGGHTGQNSYEPADTTVDLNLSARRLRDLLADLNRRHPGVPVDVVAHSQGGVVARAALTDEGDRADSRLPQVGTLVTLGSPHQGADLATAVTMVGRSQSGALAEAALAALVGDGVAADSPAVQQLAETSAFTIGLRDRPLPPGLWATSVAARADLVVNAGRTALPGAEMVTVSPPELFDDHGALPGSSAAQREMALALARMPPTCQEWADVALDFAVSESLSRMTDGAGAAGWFGGHWLDRYIGARVPKRIPPVGGPPPRSRTRPDSRARSPAS
ncbi:MAG: peptidoglycan DD-metalloendopeptidase family protein [Acidimicrobiales bacterium]